MVRKQGCVIDTFVKNDNVVDRLVQEIRKCDPTSLADKVFHVTIKTPNAYTKFIMDGFTFTTDGNGNFASIALEGTKTPEVHELRFLADQPEECVICFIY